MAVRITTLGVVTVALDQGPVPRELTWRKNAALLIYLAFSPRGRSRDHLVELLWPEGNGARSLSQALVPLRRFLPEGALESDGDLIRLDRTRLEVDVDVMARLADGRRWQEAAALVGGDFCEGLLVKDAPDFERWLASEQLRWRQAAIGVLVSLARERMDAGDLTVALEMSARARDLDRLSEPALAVQMQALTLAGRAVAALEAYGQFRTDLWQDFEAAPSAETRALAQRIKHPESATTLPSQSTGSRRVPLVGRESQLSQMLEAWRSCLGGPKASVVTIEGDPGTGRTRLAEEFLHRIRLDGAVVVQARMVPADREVPTRGLSCLAQGGLLEARGLPSASPATLAALQQAAPDWQRRFPSFNGSLPPLGVALTEAIRAIGEEHPVVLSIDDAQWADEASLQSLGATLRDLQATRLLLVMTVETHPAREAVDWLRSRVGRELAGGSVRLGPLGESDLHALARWALPEMEPAQRERLGRRLLAESAGLPLLAVELLHALVLGLDLGQFDGSWPAPFRTLTDTLPADLPDAVVAAIRVGVRRLSPEGQEILAAVAVLGEQATRSALAAATSLPDISLDGALDSLEWQRWLVADGHGYGFLARIVRQVIDRDLVSRGQRKRFLERCRAARQDL